jgi:hypothetical protein
MPCVGWACPARENEDVKWLLQNIRGRADFVVRNPRHSIGALWREFTFADERFLSRVTRSSPRQIRAFLDEPIATPEFASHLHQAERELGTFASAGADLYAKKVLNQYAAIRAITPNLVVETGIANGVSSAYLLLALQKNGRGQLHSIGLSDPAFVPAGREPGWLVPSWLRGRWQIHFGDATEILPGLLPQLGMIDAFIHDSRHTYEHMLWEFETAYPFLGPGKLLLADDATWNSAFLDFARKVSASDARILRGVGVLRKKAE